MKKNISVKRHIRKTKKGKTSLVKQHKRRTNYTKNRGMGVFYHGTRSSNIEGILKEGLKPNKDEGGRLFLTRDPAIATLHALSGPEEEQTKYLKKTIDDLNRRKVPINERLKIVEKKLLEYRKKHLKDEPVVLKIDLPDKFEKEKGEITRFDDPVWELGFREKIPSKFIKVQDKKFIDKHKKVWE